jgi:hypothetical protein
MELASYQERGWRLANLKPGKFPSIPPPPLPSPVKFPRVTEFLNTSFSAGIILRGKYTVRVIHGNLREHLMEYQIYNIHKITNYQPITLILFYK